jgi:cell wall assembly regulator SMI1
VGIWIALLDHGEFDGISSEPQNGIRDDWVNRKWIPFTHDGAGNHLCIDLDPAPAGTHGQVITMWHDGLERERMADSFLDFFKAYVKGVLSGRYLYSDDYDGIVEAADV